MKKKLIGIFAIFILLCNTALADLAPKYTQALDAFLAKLETYQNNSRYIQILDAFVLQLETLKPKYISSGDVPQMIDYLVSGIGKLKTTKLSSDKNDDFIGVLNGLLVKEIESGVIYGTKDYTENGFTWKDITIGDGNGNGYIIMDRNLGATKVSDGTETSAIFTDIFSISGNYYQWGRNETPFVLNVTGNFNWSSTSDSWGGVNDTITTTDTSTNTGARKGPCPTGYHVPSTEEWRGLIAMWFSINGQTCANNKTYYSCNWTGNASLASFMSDLKISNAGGYWEQNHYRPLSNYISANYWSSSYNYDDLGYTMYFNDTSIAPATTIKHTFGLPIRCFKN